ncbi:MAG: CBS domain-containing protein [Deltaproteobacteria bacterium]|jgi:CBS domain-containing protein|nr:Hypoxic response protein 1 [bacterium HR37]GIW47951.1 MAG: CBS domain-containing protein [Deltaproteobacteria bacterium]
MSVGKLCRREVVWVNLGTTIKEIAQIMHDKNVGSVVVVDKERKPIGIVTDRDIVIRVINEDLNPAQIYVDDVISSNILTLREDMGLIEALEYMKGKGVRRFPVVDSEGKLVGIITVDDIVRLLGKELADIANIIERVEPNV